MKACAAFAVVGALLAGVAHAELENVNLQGSGTFAWMPKIKPPDGWRPYPGLGHQIRETVLQPEEAALQRDRTSIAGKAIRKSEEPKLKSLADLIERERHYRVVVQGGNEVREEQPLKSADGRSFRVFTRIPKGGGVWGSTAYGEEGDFYLVFTLGSSSQRGHDAARQVFERVIREYR